MQQTVLFWFREDLRLSDHPGVMQALQSGCAVLPVYLYEKKVLGGASKWWLHHSLQALQGQLAALGAALILRQYSSEATQQCFIEVWRTLLTETPAQVVFYTPAFDPAGRAQEGALQKLCHQLGIRCVGVASRLLIQPEAVRNQSDKPFQVFTPFWKHCLTFLNPSVPLPAPLEWPVVSEPPLSVHLSELGLLPRIPWDKAFYAQWTPGEAGAQEQLREFLVASITQYQTDRDIPSVSGTSRLSPHLRFGEITPRQIWHAVMSQTGKPLHSGASTFLKEIGWREFAHYLLYHFPETTEHPLRHQFEQFPWELNETHLRRWCQGETGYPIVDAGMRELWTTGWMHNRVRMIAASFLVKHLLQPWQAGASWFWDTLVDADWANNTFGWQWSAGCGADAAPYFRIFNPILQGKKFDPEGTYIRRWVPELAALTPAEIHTPWQSALVPAAYSEPVVAHGAARQRALKAFALLKAL